MSPPSHLSSARQYHFETVFCHRRCCPLAKLCLCPYSAYSDTVLPSSQTFTLFKPLRWFFTHSTTCSTLHCLVLTTGAINYPAPLCLMSRHWFTACSTVFYILFDTTLTISFSVKQYWGQPGILQWFLQAHGLGFSRMICSLINFRDLHNSQAYLVLLNQAKTRTILLQPSQASLLGPWDPEYGGANITFTSVLDRLLVSHSAWNSQPYCMQTTGAKYVVHTAQVQ